VPGIPGAEIVSVASSLMTTPTSVEVQKARGNLHRIAPVPVNEWAIRGWCAAIGDLNPRYLDPDGISAPPPMLQSWVGPGLMV
jgi:hypothetical protein